MCYILVPLFGSCSVYPVCNLICAVHIVIPVDFLADVFVLFIVVR
jgi:hypothetical protein